MDALTIAQIGVSVFGSVAFLLVLSEQKRRQKIGVIFGLISNPFWWWSVIATEQWMTVPVHMLYTFGWYHKAYNLFLRKPK